MSTGIITLAAGNYTPDATWNGKLILVDNIGGQTNIMLPAANTLPAGWECDVHKIDPTSNSVEVKTTASEDSLNHFWKTTRPLLDGNGNLIGNEPQPYGLFLNLTQQSCTLRCDGVNKYLMSGTNQHRNSPQSQRTVVIPSWQLTPNSVNETVMCDVTQAGGNIFISIDQVADFCPKSFVTLGNYHSWIVSIQKVDSGPGVVGFAGAMVNGNRQMIDPNNDTEVTGTNPSRGFCYLTKQWDKVDLYINAARIMAVGSFRRSMLPGILAP